MDHTIAITQEILLVGRERNADAAMATATSHRSASISPRTVAPNGAELRVPAISAIGHPASTAMAAFVQSSRTGSTAAAVAICTASISASASDSPAGGNRAQSGTRNAASATAAS